MPQCGYVITPSSLIYVIFRACRSFLYELHRLSTAECRIRRRNWKIVSIFYVAARVSWPPRGTFLRLTAARESTTGTDFSLYMCVYVCVQQEKEEKEEKQNEEVYV